MVTVMVCGPLANAVVFHGIEVGESAHVCCATWMPSTLMVQVGVPWKLCGHTMTQLVPLTVSPSRGAVTSTVRGGPPPNCSAATVVPQPSWPFCRWYSAVTHTTNGFAGSTAAPE